MASIKYDRVFAPSLGRIIESKVYDDFVQQNELDRIPDLTAIEDLSGDPMKYLTDNPRRAPSSQLMTAILYGISGDTGYLSAVLVDHENRISANEYDITCLYDVTDDLQRQITSNDNDIADLYSRSEQISSDLSVAEDNITDLQTKVGLISNVTHFRGVTTDDPKLVQNVKIDGKPLVPTNGDVVIFKEDGKEFVFVNNLKKEGRDTNWQEFGNSNCYIVHGNVNNADIMADADIDQSKIHGLVQIQADVNTHANQINTLSNTTIPNLENTLEEVSSALDQKIDDLEEQTQDDLSTLEDTLRKEIQNLSSSLSGDVSAITKGLKEEIQAVSDNVSTLSNVTIPSVVTSVTNLRTELKGDITTLGNKFKNQLETTSTLLYGDITALRDEVESDLTALEKKFDDKLFELSSGLSTITTDKVFFNEDIICAGDYTQIGNFTKSKDQAVTLESKGENLDWLIQKFLTKELQPQTLNGASITVSITNDEVKEVGQTIVPKYKITFSPGSFQYGSMKKISDDKYEWVNGTGITCTSLSVGNASDPHNPATSGTEYTSTSTATFKDTSDYSVTGYGAWTASNKPATNLHNVSEKSAKSAGSNSSTKTLSNGYRKPFWGYRLGTDTQIDFNDLSSSTIRGLQKSGNSQGDLPTEYTVPVNTKQVVFSCKNGTAGHTNISVKNKSAMDAPITFTKKTNCVSVEGYNGYAGVGYDVFYVDFDAATSKQAVLAITWS